MSGEWGRGEELREDFWSFFFFYKVISTGVAEVGMFKFVPRTKHDFFQPIVYVLLSPFF